MSAVSRCCAAFAFLLVVMTCVAPAACQLNFTGPYNLTSQKAVGDPISVTYVTPSGVENLVVVYTLQAGDSLQIYWRSSTDGVTFTTSTLVGEDAYTYIDPSLVAANGQIYLFYATEDSSPSVLFYTWAGGSTWTGPYNSVQGSCFDVYYGLSVVAFPDSYGGAYTNFMAVWSNGDSEALYSQWYFAPYDPNTLASESNYAFLVASDGTGFGWNNLPALFYSGTPVPRVFVVEQDVYLSPNPVVINITLGTTQTQQKIGYVKGPISCTGSIDVYNGYDATNLCIGNSNTGCSEFVAVAHATSGGSLVYNVYVPPFNAWLGDYTVNVPNMNVQSVPRPNVFLANLTIFYADTKSGFVRYVSAPL